MELVGNSISSMLTSTDERRRLLALAALLRDTSTGSSNIAAMMPLVIQRFLVPPTLDKKGHLMSRRLAYQLVRVHPVYGSHWIAVANAVDRDVQIASTAGATNLTAAEVGCIALRTIVALPFGHLQEYVRSRWETLVVCISMSKNQSLRMAAVSCIVTSCTPPPGLEPQERVQFLRNTLQKPRFAELLRRLLLDPDDNVCTMAFQLLSAFQSLPSGPPTAPVLLVDPTPSMILTELGITQTIWQELLDRCMKLPVELQASVVYSVCSLSLSSYSAGGASSSSTTCHGGGASANAAGDDHGSSKILGLVDNVLVSMLHCDWSNHILVAAAVCFLSIVRHKQGFLLSLYPHMALCADKLVVAAAAMLGHSVAASCRVPGIDGNGAEAVAQVVAGASGNKGASIHSTSLATDEAIHVLHLKGANHTALLESLRALLCLLPPQHTVRSLTDLMAAAVDSAKVQLDQWHFYKQARARTVEATASPVTISSSFPPTATIFDREQGDGLDFADRIFTLVASCVSHILVDASETASTISASISSSLKGSTSFGGGAVLDKMMSGSFASAAQEAASGLAASFSSSRRLETSDADNHQHVADVIGPIMKKALAFEDLRLMLQSYARLHPMASTRGCTKIPSLLEAIIATLSPIVSNGCYEAEARAEVVDKMRESVPNKSSTTTTTTVLDQASTRQQLFLCWQIVQGVLMPCVAHDTSSNGMLSISTAEQGPLGYGMFGKKVCAALLPKTSTSNSAPVRGILLSAIELLSVAVSAARSYPGAATNTTVAKEASMLCGELDDAITSFASGAESCLLPGLISLESREDLAPLSAVQFFTSIAAAYSMFSCAIKNRMAPNTPSELLCQAIGVTCALPLLGDCCAESHVSDSTGSNVLSDRLTSIAQLLDECRATNDIPRVMKEVVAKTALLSPKLSSTFVSVESVINSAQPQHTVAALSSKAAMQLTEERADILSQVVFMRQLYSSLETNLAKKFIHNIFDDPNTVGATTEFELKSALYTIIELWDIAGAALHENCLAKGPNTTGTDLATILRTKKTNAIIESLLRYDVASGVQGTTNEDVATCTSKAEALATQLERRLRLKRPVPLLSMANRLTFIPSEPHLWMASKHHGRVSFSKVISAENDPIHIVLHASYLTGTASSTHHIEVCAVLTNKNDTTVEEMDIEFVTSQPMHFSGGGEQDHSSTGSGLTLTYLEEPKRSLYLAASPMDALAPSSSTHIQHCGSGHYVASPFASSGRLVVTGVFAVNSSTATSSAESMPGQQHSMNDEAKMLGLKAPAKSEDRLNMLQQQLAPLGVGVCVTLSAFNVHANRSVEKGKRATGGDGGFNGGPVRGGDLFATARDPSSLGDDEQDNDLGDFDKMDDVVGERAAHHNKGTAWLTQRTELLNLLPLQQILRPAARDGRMTAVLHYQLCSSNAYIAKRTFTVNDVLVGGSSATQETTSQNTNLSCLFSFAAKDDAESQHEAGSVYVASVSCPNSGDPHHSSSAAAEESIVAIEVHATTNTTTTPPRQDEGVGNTARSTITVMATNWYWMAVVLQQGPELMHLMKEAVTS